MGDLKLTDRIAHNIGDANSISSKIARLFDAAGAALVAANFRAERAHAVSEEIERNGSRVLPVELDIGDSEHWTEGVAMP